MIRRTNPIGIFIIIFGLVFSSCASGDRSGSSTVLNESNASDSLESAKTTPLPKSLAVRADCAGDFYWSSSANNGETYVLVGISKTTFDAFALSKDNGRSWSCSVIEPPSDPGLKSISYGPTGYVAIGWDRSYFSADGENWNVTSIGTGNWQSVTYGSDRFVAVGGNPQSGLTSRELFFASSLDGKSWAKHPVQFEFRPEFNVTFTSVTFGSGTFVAVGNGGESEYSATSSNGTTWRAISRFPNGFNVLSKVIHFKGKFYSTGICISPCYKSTIYSSDNGLIWTGMETQSVESIATNGSVLIGRYTNANRQYIIYSVDGSNWSELPVFVGNEAECPGIKRLLDFTPVISIGNSFMLLWGGFVSSPYLLTTTFSNAAQSTWKCGSMESGIAIN